MDKEPITVKGLENLKSELENLKNIQRPKVVAAIAEARSHGDLKENAEYHAAKEQQGFSGSISLWSYTTFSFLISATIAFYEEMVPPNLLVSDYQYKT